MLFPAIKDKGKRFLHSVGEVATEMSGIPHSLCFLRNGILSFRGEAARRKWKNRGWLSPDWKAFLFI